MPNNIIQSIDYGISIKLEDKTVHKSFGKRRKLFLLVAIDTTREDLKQNKGSLIIYTYFFNTTSVCVIIAFNLHFEEK